MVLSDENSHNLSIKSRLLKMIDHLTEDQLLILLKKVEELPLKSDRHQLRKLFPISINYRVQDHEYKGIIHNISYSGILIETSKSFSIGSEISLSFSIPSIQDPFNIAGKIVRTSALGVGVKFKDLTPEQKTTIKSLVDSL